MAYSEEILDFIAVSDTDWAYLAGLIDGEGSIRIEKGSSKYHRSPTTPTMALTNTSPKMIEWALDRFGGHLYKKKNRSCWDIYWLGSVVTPLLEGMLPYLTAKKEQAEIVLAYRKLVAKPGQGRTDPKILEERETMIELLAYLKHNQKKTEVEDLILREVI